MGLMAGEHEGQMGPRAGEHEGQIGSRAGEHEGQMGPRAGEHEGQMGSRAGEHEGQMGPRTGEHEGQMGPRAGGFHPSPVHFASVEHERFVEAVQFLNAPLASPYPEEILFERGDCVLGSSNPACPLSELRLQG